MKSSSDDGSIEVKGIYGDSGLFQIQIYPISKLTEKLDGLLYDALLENIELYSNKLADEISEGTVRLTHTNNNLNVEDIQVLTASVLVLYMSPPFGNNTRHQLVVWKNDSYFFITNVVTVDGDTECIDDIDKSIKYMISEKFKKYEN